jgi:hypothetical protein
MEVLEVFINFLQHTTMSDQSIKDAHGHLVFSSLIMINQGMIIEGKNVMHNVLVVLAKHAKVKKTCMECQFTRKWGGCLEYPGGIVQLDFIEVLKLQVYVEEGV